MTEQPATGRAVIAVYVVLALGVLGVLAIVFGSADDREAEPEIAGTYTLDAPDRCLGAAFVVKQSGQFLTISGPADEGPSSKVRVEDGRITGDLTCLAGADGEIVARATGEDIAGTAAGAPFAAHLTADPVAPGTRPGRHPGSVDGEYALAPRSVCLGGTAEIEEDGGHLELHAGNATGELEYDDGDLTGVVVCGDGSQTELVGEALDRTVNLTLGAERVRAVKQREFGTTLAAFFLIVAIVMLVARLFGVLATRIGQPRVMGEVVAGICLGPTLFGALLPDLQAALFPLDILPFIGVVANLGLIFYMFLVGLELDPAQLRGRITQAAAISNASVALPMMLGIAVAVPVYELVGPDTKFVAFALFMGVSMSVTAFPVLARILVERRMLKRPVGAMAISCAAIDDVTAWLLIALATTIAVAGDTSEVFITLMLAVAFCAAMAFIARPLLGRVSEAYDEAGRVPPGWIAAIFAGVLLSAYATEEIGIALIFGAFVMGMIMPRSAGLTEDVTHRIEDFVVTLLLPLFFAYTGLKTNFGLLDRPEMWLLTVVLIVVAIVGKLVGAAVAARAVGFDWRASGVIGVLMNTRGLTELIVLNLALEQGVISEALFAALVVMALFTTLMAGPALRLLDPKNTYGEPVEQELEDARQRSGTEFPGIIAPERSILVAASTTPALDQLLSIARPLARSEPPRELILARLLVSRRGVAVRGGLQTENLLLEQTYAELAARRLALADERIAARDVATITSNAGSDLNRLALTEEVDLVLIDGRRPLLGGGVPRGDVGMVLDKAPSDVAVLVAPEHVTLLAGAAKPIVVPFGGAEHDWAALELAAWLGAATKMPIKLLGAAGATEEPRVTRLLGDAGLLVQHYAGVSAQPVVAEPGKAGVLAAAAGAGILIIGLSERWRSEGLGETRAAIAQAAPAPVLFVRRGTRSGALAPSGDVTRFGWSSAGTASGA